MLMIRIIFLSWELGLTPLLLFDLDRSWTLACGFSACGAYGLWFPSVLSWEGSSVPLWVVTYKVVEL